jgi:hypothetical protein
MLYLHLLLIYERQKCNSKDWRQKKVTQIAKTSKILKIDYNMIRSKSNYHETKGNQNVIEKGRNVSSRVRQLC